MSRAFDESRTRSTLPTRTLCAAFLDSARRWPDRNAVTSGGRSLTYAELERASAALAHDLIQAPAAHGSFLGVFLHRSVDLSVSMLGILRAGAAFVPLDPEYPHDRLSFIASDAKLSAIVTESALSERLPGGSRAILVDQPRAFASDEIDRSELSAPAYVIYPLGPTGVPKRVVIEHENAADILRSMARMPGLSSSERVMTFTSPYLDVSVPDFFLPLTIGATLAIATRDEISNKSSGIRALEEAAEREEWLL